MKLCESDEALEAADDGLDEPCFERWTWVDALYFSMATMSTVGYGDLAPGSSGSRAFTVVFIIVGVAVVFTSIGSLMNLATEPLFDKARTLLDRLFPPRLIDVTANGVYPIRKGAAGKGDFRHPGARPFTTRRICCRSRWLWSCSSSCAPPSSPRSSPASTTAPPSTFAS